MTGFNFTAVAATDLFTKVGHGLTTGDGPATTIVAGGALGGLDSSLDYWAIRIDADTFKLATSSANALVGTPVDVTADIGGFLGVGIPYRRARTYVPKSVNSAGSQLRSADLNALQDAAQTQGVRQVAFHHSGWTGTDGTSTVIAHSSAGYSTLSASGNFYRALDLKVGSKIGWATFNYNRKGAGTVTPRIQRVELATGTISAVVAGSADNSSPDAIQAVTLDAGSHAVAAGYAYYLAVAATDVANRLYGATLLVHGEAG